MDENFGHCSNPSSSYGKVKSIHETGVLNSTCPFVDKPIKSNFADHIEITLEADVQFDNSTEEDS